MRWERDGGMARRHLCVGWCLTRLVMEGHDLSLADELRPLDRLGALLGAVTDLLPAPQAEAALPLSQVAMPLAWSCNGQIVMLRFDVN
jgi:hypothetical protein